MVESVVFIWNVESTRGSSTEKGECNDVRINSCLLLVLFVVGWSLGLSDGFKHNIIIAVNALLVSIVINIKTVYA